MYLSYLGRWRLFAFSLRVFVTEACVVYRGSGTVVPLADMFELASTLCTSAYMRDGTFLVQ